MVPFVIKHWAWLPFFYQLFCPDTLDTLCKFLGYLGFQVCGRWQLGLIFFKKKNLRTWKSFLVPASPGRSQPLMPLAKCITKVTFALNQIITSPNLPDCNLGIFCSFFLGLPELVSQDKSILKHQSSLVTRIWYLFFLALQSSLACVRKKVSQQVYSMCSCILVLPLWSP